MSILILAHIVTGCIGIAAGLIVVAGTFARKPMPIWNGVFLSMTAATCVTGFVFLPTNGVTSAQIVAFYLTFLLAIATYARYVRRLSGSWKQVYAITAVGALFLNILIATAQSFLHFQSLKVLAPTQHSPVYVAVKFSLLGVFLAIAFVAARRAGRS